MTRPARGYSWPAADAGNMLALKHGAWSDRLVEPRALEIVEALLALVEREHSPVAYFADESYAAAVRRWAKTEARLELLDD